VNAYQATSISPGRCGVVALVARVYAVVAVVRLQRSADHTPIRRRSSDTATCTRAARRAYLGELGDDRTLL